MTKSQAISTTIIYLCTTIARRLNCDLPECDGETDRLACLTRGARQLHSVWSSSGWGLPSRSSHPDRWCALTAPFHPYHAFVTIHRGESIEPFGGLLSVALSLTSRPVDVIDHPVLRSPDFPPVSGNRHPATVPPTHGYPQNDRRSNPRQGSPRVTGRYVGVCQNNPA